MQQGTFVDEDQRRLSHDDVATILYGMSGLDETASNGDDYTLELSYAGRTSSCDIVLAFDNSETGFAVCQVSGFFIGGTDHVRISAAESFFNTGFNWYFNPTLTLCGNGVIEGAESCDDGNALDGDCCSALCEFEPAGSGCEDGDLCTEGDTCNGAGACNEGAPLDCDDSVFCNGNEICDAVLGCRSGGDPCAGLMCDEVFDRCEAPPEVVFAEVESGSALDVSSVSTSGAVTAVAGDLYLAVISYKPASGVSSVTGLGLDWSLAGAHCSGRSQTGVEAWQALGTPTGSGIVTADLTSSPGSSVISVARYANVRNDAIGSVVSGNTKRPRGCLPGRLRFDGLLAGSHHDGGQRTRGGSGGQAAEESYARQRLRGARRHPVRQWRLGRGDRSRGPDRAYSGTGRSRGLVHWRHRLGLRRARTASGGVSNRGLRAVGADRLRGVVDTHGTRDAGRLSLAAPARLIQRALERRAVSRARLPSLGPGIWNRMVSGVVPARGSVLREFAGLGGGA
jgi:cysteine-rich repeat protein